MANVGNKIEIPLSRVAGLGIAMPDDLGTLAFPGKPPAYAGWADIDVAGLFRLTYQGPTFVENDAVAAAIGELQFGHGLDAPTFVYILISVLLGGGIVINRNYFRGENGRSGEIGFMQVKTPAGVTCSLQDVVSLGALSERLKSHGLMIARPDDLTHLDGSGAKLVDEWLEEACGYLTSIFAQDKAVHRSRRDHARRASARTFARPPGDAVPAATGRCPLGPVDRRPPRQAVIGRAGNRAAILPFQNFLLPSLEMLERF